jgi:glucose/mannose transport system permease protein
MTAGAVPGKFVGPQGPRPRRWWAPSRVFIYGVLILMALFYLFPLYVVIVTSFKDQKEVMFSGIFALPARPTVEGWVKAWDTGCIALTCEGIKIGFWNSMVIVVPSVTLSILAGSVCGYVLAYWPYRGAEFFFLLLLLCIFIPQPVLLYPIAQLLGTVKLMGTVWAAVLVNIVMGLPFMALLFRSGFASVPPDLWRAARVDGAGFWRIYAQIVMPLMLPTLGVALVLSVTYTWGDYMFTMVFGGPYYPTITMLYHNLVDSRYGVAEYNVQMAATILTGAVPLLVYFLCGRLFMRGVAVGVAPPR